LKNFPKVGRKKGLWRKSILKATYGRRGKRGQQDKPSQKRIKFKSAGESPKRG